MTSTSLLASAMVLPASIAASTASRPAVPDDAHSTMSTYGMRGDGDQPVGAAVDFARHAARARAGPAARRARGGRDGGDRRPVPRDLLREQRRVLAGRQADDLQAVGIARRRRQRAAPDGPVRAEDRDRASRSQIPQEQIEHRRGEQIRVDAIEHAAVTGNQRRAVLHAGAALEQRLEQIAGDAERAPGSSRRAPRHEAAHVRQSPGRERRRRRCGATTRPPMAPSIVLPGLTSGASLRRPNVRPV